MAKRLTAKEIKQDIREDEIQNFLARIFMILESRPKAVLGVLGAVVAVVLLVAAGLALLDSRKEAALGELAEAIEIYEAPVTEDGETPDPSADLVFASDAERFEKSKEAFGKIQGIGTSIAGEVASLYLAEIAIREGDRDKARKIWEGFLDHSEDHMLAVSVRLNLIHLDRDEGKAAEVAEALEKELDDPRKTLPEDVLLFELAQTREALGEDAAALELYRRIVDEFPQSSYVGKARQVTTSRT